MSDHPDIEQQGGNDKLQLSTVAEEIKTNSDSSEREMTSLSSERDEVAEVKKASQKDTARVRMLRFVVTGLLLVTALAVTLTTYRFLKLEEESDFETAFEKFAMIVEVAAVEQQKDLRDAYRTLANTLSATALYANATWPFFSMPRFEQFGRDTLDRASTEILSVLPKVSLKDREDWIEYTNKNHKLWMKEGYDIESLREGKDTKNHSLASGYHPYITKATPDGFVPDDDRPFFFPIWSSSPPPFSYGAINLNIASIPDYEKILMAAEYLKNETLTTLVRPYRTAGDSFSQEEHEAMHGKLRDSKTEHPHSMAFHPIHKDPDNFESEMVGCLITGMAWDASLQKLLPEGVKGIIAVIHNNCNQSYTYELDGTEATFVGPGDHHESEYDFMKVEVPLAPHSHPEFESTTGHCIFSMSIYASSVFEKSYDSNTPEIFAAVVASTFALVAIAFFTYDVFVQRRNERLIEKTARSNAVVSNMFPAAIRDKLLGVDEDTPGRLGKRGNLKSVLKSDIAKLASPESKNFLESKPLADLFLETTILFADLVGFTAWSSVRDPCQCFTLLETLFGTFDEWAKKSRVFKVETVGDCYVAATGIPEPRRDHAKVMCKFAAKILSQTTVLMRQLEVTLGPDTGDLTLRVGIHSGPVTAGVLRGDKARFQLFGDTMNMTSRIEASGSPGRIHISTETAKILKASGKEYWISKREDTVYAKGKGEIQTYWLTSACGRGEGCAHSVTNDTSSSHIEDDEVPIIASKDGAFDEKDKLQRQIEWVTQMLLDAMKQIVAMRNARAAKRNNDPSGEVDPKNSSLVGVQEKDHVQEKESYVDMVKEVIVMPEYDKEAAKNVQDLNTVELPEHVVAQTREYVSWVASTYSDNPFHSFEHAAHVVMSVSKLMSRIVAPAELFEQLGDEEEDVAADLLHDHTYGITSDPLTPYSCMMAALIHDADHPGVPNTQLLKEETRIAIMYGRSIAEQNSCAVTWDCFADPAFAEMRKFVYETPEEMFRFRELVINAVMATDIADKEFKVLRNDRWDRAFNTVDRKEDPRLAVNRKATIVIEYLMQASDVAHTMQHWHVYRKWNERFFRECYKAYKMGRAETDPSLTWYKGEIGFFDFYIIPLAKKLKECGVFGKSSDEYLNYALQNRHEWETRGEEIVSEMTETAQLEFP